MRTKESNIFSAKSDFYMKNWSLLFVEVKVGGTLLIGSNNKNKNLD